MKVDDLADESSLSVIQIFEHKKDAFLGRGAKCVRRKYAFRPQMHGVPLPSPSFFLNWVHFSVIFSFMFFWWMSERPTLKLPVSRQFIAGALLYLNFLYLRIVCSINAEYNFFVKG